MGIQREGVPRKQAGSPEAQGQGLIQEGQHLVLPSPLSLIGNGPGGICASGGGGVTAWLSWAAVLRWQILH